METNPRAYKAELHRGEESAFVVIVTYGMAAGKPHRGTEFFQLMTSFDASEIEIPSHRQATLAEELMRLDKAACMLPAVNRRVEMSLIGDKLKGIYGDGIALQITPLGT